MTAAKTKNTARRFALRKGMYPYVVLQTDDAETLELVLAPSAVAAKQLYIDDVTDEEERAMVAAWFEEGLLLVQPIANRILAPRGTTITVK